MSNFLKNLKFVSASKNSEAKDNNYAEINNNPNSLNDSKSFSRSRTNVDDKGIDKDLANIKAEIDKIRQNEIVVLDENTKSHFKEFLHKNSDKFVRRASSKDMPPNEQTTANAKKTNVLSPQPTVSSTQKNLKSAFASTKLLNDSSAKLNPEEIELGINKEPPKDATKHANGNADVDQHAKASDKKPPKLGLGLNFKNLMKASQNSNDESVKKPETVKIETEKPANEKPAGEKVVNENPPPEKPAVRKLAVGGGGGMKGLLARLKEASLDKNEAVNNSEINSANQLLVGAKVENDKGAANQAEVKDPGNPPDITRSESGKKSTFAKLIEKLGPKKNEKDTDKNELKRHNSIKQKLLEEEIDDTKINDDYDTNRLRRFKQKIHLILYHPEWSRWATLYVLSTLVLILVDISLIIAETEPSLNQPNLWVQITRYLWPIYFLDFCARIFIYDAFYETFWEFISHINIIVDLVALLYSGVEILWYMCGNYSTLPILVKMMRVFVVGRLLRGFRLPIFNKGVDILQQGLKKSRKPLGILAFFAILSVLAIASLVYFAESISLPGDDSGHQINNLPTALWWAIITVTTVGYGDTVPQSVAGKIIASFSLLFGVLLLSLPVAIIGNQFQEQYLKDLQQNTQKERKLAQQNMNKIESTEEKEIYKMIVKLNELEEVNEKIEAYLKENQFLYRSITRDALNLINKIELSNRKLHEVKSKETKIKEILISIRKKIIQRRKKKT